MVRDQERLSERSKAQDGLGIRRSAAYVAKSDKNDLVVLADEVVLDKLPGEDSQLVAWIIEEGVGVLRLAVVVRFGYSRSENNELVLGVLI